MKKWIILALVLILAAGGACYYWYIYRPAAANADAPAVVTAKVERGSIRLMVSSTGRVVSNLDVDIKCKASGEVTKLPFDVSDTVKKDALLAELDPADEQRVVRRAEVELQAADAKLRIAQESLAIAERTLLTDRERARTALEVAQVHATDARAKADRMKQLLAKNLCSQEDCDTAQTAASQADSDLSTANVRLDELKTQELALELRRQDVKSAQAVVDSDKIALDIAKDRLDDTKVYAPIDGVVAVRNVQIGQIIASGVSNVGGGTTILTLSDLSRVFVLASVDESDIGKVRLDQPVTVTVDAFHGRKFDGKVVRIATKGVNLSNVVTFEVKIEVVSGDKELLKPEMTANVDILAAEKDGALFVPGDAILRKGGGKQIVTVVKDGGANEEVAVETGISDGTNTEITTGLSEGQTVQVHKGVADGKWGAPLRPPRGMMR
ncbi:MAG: efflux RND transporter periplasmic adaptor subunit [Planctomycetes bacterium]|nr:efflux RND transporter periplasmic adaptor subunit [Planctomycetota bacterium]